MRVLSWRIAPRPKSGSTTIRHATRIVMMLLVCQLLWSGVVQAETAVGHVVLVKGAATIRHISGAAVSAAFGADVMPMDTLETASGELKVLFEDKTLLFLGANTKVLLTEHVYDPSKGERSTIYDIVRGTVRAVVDQPSVLKKNDVRLQTPTAVAGIRGTDVGVNLSGRTSRMVCFNGLFEAYAKSNPEGKVMVKTGQWTDISGPIPSSPQPVTQDTLRQFSDVLTSASLQEVINQRGAALSAAPPAAAQSPAGAPPPPVVAPQAPPPPQQPATPPIVPGGTTNTPSDAGGSTPHPSTTAPVTTPLTFPH
jgi:hypothetical protein